MLIQSGSTTSTLVIKLLIKIAPKTNLKFGSLHVGYGIPDAGEPVGNESERTHEK